ncbi:MAG TPA: cell division protein ZipA [Gammaproteobacteria bacterium]|nr:cell division protein ZipA [Pseudomonadota bacterium]HBF10119.1 cell division protein ZipA [Gammaproteobacteria bacterium]HCK91959.1 cell division protein ZipA [Gammaproteobacteria bacterium]|tara:strand:- start:48929 stop:50083 length:1155 start_codon:yes stop_codon:yes gene_type:complete
MDIGMREILIVMGCIIMAVLFFDAYRRVRDHRRSQFGHRLNDRPRTSAPATLDGFDDDEMFDDEDKLTPVRPVGQSSGRIGHGKLGQQKRESVAPAAEKQDPVTARATARGKASAPKQIRVRISAPKGDGKSASEQVTTQTSKSTARQKIKDDLFPGLSANRSDTPMKALLQPALASAPEAGDFYSNRRNSAAARNALQAQTEKKAAEQKTQDKVEPELKKAAPAQPQEPQEVIIMHVVAPENEVFDGEVLVHQALALNLRHGDMKIFHRYERPEQHQGHLFSMANLVKPGFFELDHMNAFETPGVTFFLSLPCSGGALYAFDLMIDTARKLSKALDGELRDETQSIITPQTVEHYRQRVQEFERKQRMMEKTRQIRERSKIFE